MGSVQSALAGPKIYLSARLFRVHKKGYRHEYPPKPCSSGIASRRYSHPDRTPVVELHCRIVAAYLSSVGILGLAGDIHLR